MNNTTLISVQENIQPELTNSYDSVGAVVFIVGVIMWYSLSVILLLGMQTMSPSLIVEDSIRHSKLFTQNFREKTNNKKILGKKKESINQKKIKSNENIFLEELADKEKRDKLWDIYFGTSKNKDDKINRAETLRIRNIQQQLATIKEIYRDDDELVQSFNDPNSLDFNIGSSVPDISAPENRLRARRQSPMDQQILEEWKTTVDDLNLGENAPWTTQRLLIQRHLRRQRRIRTYRS